MIKYLSGYEYQLVADYQIQTPIFPPAGIQTSHVWLWEDGMLAIKEGYAWDGPSGPAFHTRDFMRGSLVHDALYQLMRDGHLDIRIWKEHADRLLQQICVEDGMFRARAWWVYQAVRHFGASSASGKREPLTAP